jgi:H-type small acid-soluble spore protein
VRLERAQEIMNSTANIDVFYRHNPVWIEGLDSGKGNADITMLDSKTRMNVPIWDLEEK